MYTSCFVEKFNNTVLVYSCLIPNSSNNVEGLVTRSSNNEGRVTTLKVNGISLGFWTDVSETRDSICLLTP